MAAPTRISRGRGTKAWENRSKKQHDAEMAALGELYGTKPTKGAKSSTKAKKKPVAKRKRKPKAKTPQDPNNPLERVEQRLVVVYSQKRKLPFYAVPNAARRTMWEAIQAKRDGMQGGIPDLVYPVALNGYNGLYIEMKRRQGGVISPKQKYWHQLLALLGYRMEVCKGADMALAVLDDYFQGWEPTPEMLALEGQV